LGIIFFAFILALLLALLLTPVVRWLGMRLGAVDMPNHRKFHKNPVPRIGGLAIIASLFFSLLLCQLIFTDVCKVLIWNSQRIFYVTGGLLIFAVGLLDDFKRLGPKVKFLAQILAASLAFYGGMRIESIMGVSIAGVYYGLLSWAITVFWFLLFINAINLIDGLDGLAAGISLFAVTVMAVLLSMKGDYLLGIKFALLGGVLLGFLRYNFNPASIFLGDGGSYLIGYIIAALSIVASIKTTVGTTFLIPLVALGVPVLDTILAPVRRFFSGKKIFLADSEHIHHKLLQKGLKPKNAVLLIYGVTCALCALAIILIHLRDAMVALILALLTLLIIFVMRKLGYFESFFFDRVYGWFRDLTDATRNTAYNGSFLDLQAQIKKSGDLDTLWNNLCKVFEFMQFDSGELHIEAKEKVGAQDDNSLMPEKMFTWHRDNAAQKGIIRIEVSINAGNPVNARLVFSKDNSLKNMRPYTLRRVEYLRRSVKEALDRIYSS
jgi:UDP-GlcNAc:undecaprenyl-phosphate GlcNAc-1-phosphate transferase